MITKKDWLYISVCPTHGMKWSVLDKNCQAQIQESKHAFDAFCLAYPTNAAASDHQALSEFYASLESP